MLPFETFNVIATDRSGVLEESKKSSHVVPPHGADVKKGPCTPRVSRVHLHNDVFFAPESPRSVAGQAQ